MNQPRKILASAYACEPEKGSEPGIGWNLVREIARRNDVWVITREANRTAIERELRERPLEGAKFCYYDLPRWARFWKRGQRGVNAYYYLWQAGAYFVGRRLHREVGFDVVHHLTFLRYWTPSFVGLLPPPFVWGPVGGGESAPGAFRRSFSARGKAHETLRDAARVLFGLDPFLRWTARRAAVALATTAETLEQLQKLGARRSGITPGIGLPEADIARLGLAPARRDGPFRVVSLGRLLHWKGFDLGLKAFAALARRHPASEYWLIGEGPERKRLERLAGELGLNGQVKFWGALPRTELLDKLVECDALLYPSLHDSGGWVCLEAMAAGRPVVCLDLGGPATQVTAETGIKAPARTPEQSVQAMAAGLERLADDPAWRLRLGEASRRRVREVFAWDRRGEYLEQAYRMAVEGAREC